MHDDTYLYFSAVFADPFVGLNSLALMFLDENTGGLAAGASTLVANVGTPGFDDYFNGQCCFLFDANDGGTNDITAVATYANGAATFEIRTPLCSADTAHDFCLAPGSSIGFNIFYQSGNGAIYGGYPASGYFDEANYATLFIGQPTLTVGLDIYPGTLPNVLNPNSRGKTPVAILSSPTFDATTQVVTSSLTFGQWGGEASLLFCNGGGEDVNGDGLLDLVCHFDTTLTGFGAGATQGVLQGRTTSGARLTGSIR
jgi:hypothetical protein